MKAQVYNNGAVVTTVTHGISDVCTVHVGFSIGMGNCGMDEKCHMAHVAEHMIAQLASRSYPDHNENKQVLNEQGVVANAWTDEHRTVYHATGPSRGICMYLRMLMCTLAQRYVHTGTANELESVRQELSAAVPEDGRKTRCKVRELMYGEDPLLLEHSILYVEDLQRDIGLATASIKEFIDRFYVAESTNIIIAASAKFVTGVKDAAEVLINTMGGTANPALPVELKYCTPWTNLDSQQFIVHERGMDPQHRQARVTFLYEIQNLNKTMRYEKLCMKVAGCALAGSVNSRLYKRLRDELGMVYSVICSTLVPNTNMNTAALHITTQTKETNIANVVDEVKKAVLKLHSKGVTRRELSNFKNTTRVLLKEGFADMSTHTMANRITNETAWHRRPLSLKNRNMELERLQLADVNTTVRNHFRRSAGL